MKTGAWINYKNGKVCDIGLGEHQFWIREPENAKRLRLDAELITKIADWPIGFKGKRIEFLSFLLQKAPLIRFRGHREYVTYETYAMPNKDVLQTIWKHAQCCGLGPLTAFLVNSIADNSQQYFVWQDWNKEMTNSYQQRDCYTLLRLRLELLRKRLEDQRLHPRKRNNYNNEIEALVKKIEFRQTHPMLPKIVIRYLAAVYGDKHIPQEFLDEKGLIDPDSLPFLIDWIKEKCRETKLKMCLLRGWEDCIYVEPDGTMSFSIEPPTGGFALAQIAPPSNPHLLDS